MTLVKGVALPGLQRARHLAALTQAELAELAGLQRVTVVRLERGGIATASTVRRLAEALHVPPARLVRQPVPKAHSQQSPRAAS
jgi:transcriptional regulator with XRE-family HTH domain